MAIPATRSARELSLQLLSYSSYLEQALSELGSSQYKKNAVHSGSKLTAPSNRIRSPKRLLRKITRSLLASKVASCTVFVKG